eukprot:EG_transcript_9540
MSKTVRLAEDTEDPANVSIDREPSAVQLHERFTSFLQSKYHFTGPVKKLDNTGVIYVTNRAVDLGYHYGNPEWSNFGQGAPEVGPIPDAPPRAERVVLDLPHQEYAPVNGILPLREAVARYYNALYRRGKASQYTERNVCIVPGGRAGLIRLMSTLDNCSVGYFLPDYTAYAQALGVYNSLGPQPLLQDDETALYMPPAELRRKVKGLALSALLMSNPCNPTGSVVRGDDLREYVDIARETNCLFMMDEFYSHYIYDEEPDEAGRPPSHSSASFVENVNEDPIVIVNGLTKCWRLPGWRICWVVGPEAVIEGVMAAGSYLDGGANNPLQLHALPYLDLDFIEKDTRALQAHFRAKRDWVIQELRALGIKVHCPSATFYAWADVSGLPAPLNDGVIFFEHCLLERVIVVPGIFFDLSPRGLRSNHAFSPCKQFVRLSFGPEWNELRKGIEGIKRVVRGVQGGAVQH